MRSTIDLSELRFDWGDSNVQIPPIAVRHVKTFRIKSDGIISSICPTCDSVAWVACNNENSITLYGTDGKEVKRMRLDFYVEDLKLTKLKNLLVTASLGSKIRLITTNSSEVTDFVNCTPLQARGLHISASKEVLVTLRADDKGRVVKFSHTGEILRELTLNRAGIPLYSDPDRVTQNSIDDVIVLDWNKRQIISVDKLCRTKFIYDGKCVSVGMNTAFTPSDIVCDKYDNILISDCEGDCVHMIDKDGNFLKHVVTDKNGLSSPCAIALDDVGQLWIGQMDGQIHVLTYYEKS